MIFPVAICEPIVLLLILTLPFRWAINPWKVLVLAVLIAILEKVLPVIFENAPIAELNRNMVRLGVPVVPVPIYVHAVPAHNGALPPKKLLVIVKFTPNAEAETDIAPSLVAVVSVNVLGTDW